MPFDKVPQKIDFPAGEQAILAFWREHAIFDKTLAKNVGAETFKQLLIDAMSPNFKCTPDDL